EVEGRDVRAGQNVLPQGREMRRGETVLAAGSVLRPQELGLLAAVGRTSARLVPPPGAAVLSTGDEVVEASRTPGPGQSRNGTRPRPDGTGETLVFGLPGNPVSALVCFELFVRPALRGLRGDPEPGPRLLRAELAEDFPYRTDRPTYHPALLTPGGHGWRVRL